ncbi:unnamed protein product [Linum trigynum]
MSYLMNHPVLSKYSSRSTTHQNQPNPNQPKPHGKDVVVEEDVVPTVPGDVNLTPNINHDDKAVTDFARDQKRSIRKAIRQEERSRSGRTHSLPHPKNGPYKCPKCKEVHQISQTFAAHMRNHYRSESKKERNERLAARFNKRRFRFVGLSSGGSSSGGSTTMWPVGRYEVKTEHPHLPPVISTVTGKEWRNIQSMAMVEATSSEPNE